MKHIRLIHAGHEQWGVVTSDESAITLADGKHVRWNEITLLPPATSGATIFALGLNYADHSAELGFKPPSQPLVFLKGPNGFVAHGGISPKPRDADQMHPECELVAVIGRTARHVAARDALDHVSGYTIACDYAVREFLENYYRPNLRVKNRDALTPLGPWVVDAADVGDPQALALSTTVNGTKVQSGSTADMVFPVAELIAYLSSFMTLSPGDMILTGTPHGVHFVSEGDEVACEIDRVGRLVHRVGLQP
ncbi:MAG: fumarylacetoacetate hydrolase family protein [Pseudomonadota bacterium]|jgi:5-oxopent-3-ene-1,2,5-tricarboxylate decarboxylase/2-hydroxyhepta-2,4-diene-1,7-dioate isomerase|uniref:5-carboxymethyl-2-oxo-hex-3-ene-1,7-dioate decarboxylase / 2-hydroxyhepta-2,4-diene-1,7-dioate isomerase \